MTAAQGTRRLHRSPAPTRSTCSSRSSPETVAFDPNTGEFLAEYKNGQFASFGSCGDRDRRRRQGRSTRTATGSEQTARAERARDRGSRRTLARAARRPMPPTGTPVAGASVGGQHDRRRRRRDRDARRAGPGDASRRTRSDAIRSKPSTSARRPAPTAPAGRAVRPRPRTAQPQSLVGRLRDQRQRRALRHARPHARAAAVRGIAEGQRFARGSGPARAARRRRPRRRPGCCREAAPDAQRPRALLDVQRRAPSASCASAAARAAGSGSASATARTRATCCPRGCRAGATCSTSTSIDKAYNRDDARRRGGNRIVFHVG